MKQRFSGSQLTFLVILRMCLGWFFLYQGLLKYWDPAWSAEGFLKGSTFLTGFFQLLASGDGILAVVNFLNVYGQIAIGLGLIVGLFTNIATIAGVVMLALYYLAHPPFAQLQYQGSDIIVNDQLIMILSLLVVYKFPTGRLIGLDRFMTDDIESQEKEGDIVVEGK